MATREQCRFIVRHIWDSLDGELPPELEARVVDHLEQCTTCRSHFDFERVLLGAVRTYGGTKSAVEFGPLRARVVRALAWEGITLHHEVEWS